MIDGRGAAGAVLAGAAPAVGERAVAALDRARRWLWRWAARTRAGRACARDRSTRVCALGLGHVALALALTAVAPALLLLVGPLVLGVPHVIADLRYLIVRGPASLRPATIVALAAPLAALTGLAAMTLLGGLPAPGLAIALGASTVALAVALAPGRPARRLAAVALVAMLAVPAVQAPTAALAALLFGHDLVALAIWSRWTRATVRPRHRAIVLGAVAAGVAAIAAGAVDGAAASATPPGWTGGLDPRLAHRLIAAHAFLQAVHYAVWLRLIPATQARQPAAPTFRRTVAGLRADLGAGLPVLAAVAVAVPLLALAGDAARVRDGYLELALAHVWLELAIVGYLIVGRERLEGA